MTIEVLDHFLPSKKRTKPVTTIVLHATAGGSLDGAISTLRARALSYHYLIADQRDGDGRVKKCAPTANQAFHAGESTGPDGRFVNGYSIGISFVNANNGTDPYSAAQFESAKALILELMAAFPSIEWLTTHYWVSPGRKTDPRGFDVLRLASEVDLKVWNGGRPVLK